MLLVETSWENKKEALYELLKLIKDGRKSSQAERIFLSEVHTILSRSKYIEQLNYGTKTYYYKKLAKLIKKIENA